MSTQQKAGTSLNDAQQERLRELLENEPLLTRSRALSLGLDLLHAVWRRAGRDLKTALGAMGEPVIHGGRA